MKASPADQRLLLDIAALDDRYDRAKRTKENPPQAARVRELVEQRTAENRVLAERVGERDALRTELTKVDSDVDLATTRRERDAKRLEQATDLATIKALEQELASLARRLDGLETAQLELMEKIEPAETAVAEQEATVRTTIEEGQRLSAEGKEGVISAAREMEEASRDRAAVASGVPDALLTMYERLRTRGAGASLFARGVCGGCHMALAQSDLAALRTLAEDEVATCPECGGILVRTDESGLGDAGDGHDQGTGAVSFS